ncbi:MAG: 30S ribosomal protein S4 [Candidatus Micrarchaeia archaeon]
MGDPRRLRKKYETPRKVWDSARIKEEKSLKEKYGLKNMKEVWIAKEELRKIRREVRKLFGSKNEKKERELLEKIKRMGYMKKENLTLEDALNLVVEDILERRLQTLVYRKGLAKTIKQARQLIVHGHISVNNKRMRSPGALIPVSDEDKITYYRKVRLPKASEGKMEKEEKREEKLKEAIEKIEV